MHQMCNNRTSMSWHFWCEDTNKKTSKFLRSSVRCGMQCGVEVNCSKLLQSEFFQPQIFKTATSFQNAALLGRNNHRAQNWLPWPFPGVNFWLPHENSDRWLEADAGQVRPSVGLPSEWLTHCAWTYKWNVLTDVPAEKSITMMHHLRKMPPAKRARFTSQKPTGLLLQASIAGKRVRLTANSVTFRN